MKIFTKTIFLLFLCYVSGHSQVQIGAGTNESQAIPIEPYYDYSYTQSIYLQTEIGYSGSITAIQYYYSGLTSLANSDDNIQIWIGHTTKTSFSSTTDWTPTSGMTQVFNGTIPAPTNPGTDEWITITLTTPFMYNNSDNLIIAVDANEPGNDSSSDDFHCTSVTGNRSIYYRSDNINPDPSSPPVSGATLVSYIPNTRLIGLNPLAPECATSNSPATGSTVILSCGGNTKATWTSSSTGGAPDSYDVYLGTTSGNLALQGNTTNKNYTFTNLTGGTYYWQVIPKNAVGTATGCPEWSFIIDDTNPVDSGTGDEGYSFINSYGTNGPAFSWIDPIAGNHTEITTMSTGDADDGFFHVTNMGINFNYYGSSTFTDCYIGTNGYVSFGQGYTISAYNATIPSASEPNKMIAACMMDLDSRTNGKIYYKQVGTNFVITWYKYHDYADESEYLSFQVILEGDADGGFTIQYNDAISSANIPDILIDAVIGAEFTDATGVVYRSNGVGGPVFCSPVAVQFSKAPLPVDLLSFEGRAMEKSNKLVWVTATEENTEWHIIERSDDGRNGWNEVGRKNARGFSQQNATYTFLDFSPKLKSYYRLKSVDFDGYSDYSDIIKIKRQSERKEISLFPNPTNGLVTLEFDIDYAQKVNLEVTDITGKIVQSSFLDAIKGVNNHTIDISELSKGIYFVSIHNDFEKITNRLLKF